MSNFEKCKHAKKNRKINPDFTYNKSVSRARVVFRQNPLKVTVKLSDENTFILYLPIYKSIVSKVYEGR